VSALWLAATVVAGMVLYMAAHWGEVAMALRPGRPRRIVWGIAMVYLSAVSFGWLVPSQHTSGGVTVEWVAREIVTPITRGAVDDATLTSSLAQLQGVGARLVAVYVFAASSGAALLLAIVYRRHVRTRRTWEATELHGVPVLVSRTMGPALSGFVRPRIVVPTWVLDLDGGAQRAILLHETEHRRAGDHVLQAFAAMLLIANAWNPMIWLYCRRLLRAIELDCDERVISRGIAPAEYAGVLLDAYQRTAGWSAWLPYPALAERASGLGRRVENLFRPQARNLTMKTIATASLALAMSTLTAFAPAPQVLRASTPPSTEAVQQMKDVLKTLVAAQESYYADHGSYTTDMSALSAAIKKPFNKDAVWVRVSFAGGVGWTGIAQSRDLKNARCVVYIGDPTDLPKLPQTFGQQTPQGEGAITCDKP
jgi:beta-lactamase regulating signal transducer with metallopeptidase domain